MKTIVTLSFASLAMLAAGCSTLAPPEETLSVPAGSSLQQRLSTLVRGGLKLYAADASRGLVVLTAPEANCIPPTPVSLSAARDALAAREAVTASVGGGSGPIIVITNKCMVPEIGSTCP